MSEGITVTRWLSRSGVASRIYTNYPALVQQFSTDDSDYASSLENLMKEEWFVTSLSCFTDLLAELALLSKQFQRDSVSNRQVKSAVDAVRGSIQRQYMQEESVSLTFGGRKAAQLRINRSMSKDNVFDFWGVQIEISHTIAGFVGMHQAYNMSGDFLGVRVVFLQ
jgi:hypothetical protein